MPVDVVTSIVIDLPRAEVARFAIDPKNAPTWYENIRSAAWTTKPPLALGSRIAFVARFLGRELRYTYSIIEYEESRRLVMRTAEGPFPMETIYTFEDEPFGTTRVTLRNRGEPSGFSALVAPIMSIAMRRANQKDLARLKQVLEGG